MLAEQLARLTLACIKREFPYQPAHVLRSATDLKRPRHLHPAFYGCYDWHSAVHGHWLLAHLLRCFPSLPQARSIRKILDSHLSAVNLKTEARYLHDHSGFERPYGWTWLLKLAHELAGWEDAGAQRWLANLQPLIEVIEAHYLAWLPKQTYPIRAGVHTNTAFGLTFALDYAESRKRSSLVEMIRERSIHYFGSDRDYPAAWEPGGNDFLSPCLVEADLMRRVYREKDFSKWLRRFLPGLPAALAKPVTVSDRSDGQLAHLDGLNLCRAWCFFSLAPFIPEKRVFLKTAKDHLASGLKHVASGEYAGEHWLASFAALALAAAP